MMSSMLGLTGRVCRLERKEKEERKKERFL